MCVAFSIQPATAQLNRKLSTYLYNHEHSILNIRTNGFQRIIDSNKTYAWNYLSVTSTKPKPLAGALLGMTVGTLFGGLVGIQIGKGDRESLIGAIRGGLIGATIGNSLFIPLGATSNKHTIHNLPLALGLSVATGIAGYYFAHQIENADVLLMVPIIQLSISVIVGSRPKKK